MTDIWDLFEYNYGDSSIRKERRKNVSIRHKFFYIG